MNLMMKRDCVIRRFFFFQAEDGIRDVAVTGVQTCALPIFASPAGLPHERFTDFAQFLEPGDLVVVNTSATLPAAVDGRRGDGRAVTVHFSTADRKSVV